MTADPVVKPAPTDPHRWTLSLSDSPRDVGQWLSGHGYRVMVPAPMYVEAAGVVYSRPGGPVEMAVIGQTLVFNPNTGNVEVDDDV
ncbi:hypothetical protein ACFRNT_11365 [Streptomyces sp. NPDC056697]|uniref:hypothetical protein n=1 Tax=Streptomyces sp. NPDC056697 TaxID=3345915 RepID=UPI0036AD656E